MEKLIELLNERYQERYNTKTRFDKFENYGGNDYGYFQSNNNELFMSETDVWTKKYGFIKRLVENDKINKDLVSRVLIRAYVSPENYVSLECEFHDYYESLLMLLSISDTPIEDLVSYLI